MTTFDNLYLEDFFVSLEDSKVYCKWTARYAVDNITDEVVLLDNPKVVKIPRPKLVSSKVLERWPTNSLRSDYVPVLPTEAQGRLLLQGDPPGQGYCSVCGEQLIIGYIYQNHGNCINTRTKGHYES